MWRVKRICVLEHSVMTNLLLVWASSGGSGETTWMRRLTWTFAARIGDKYQIRLTRSKWYLFYLIHHITVNFGIFHETSCSRYPKWLIGFVWNKTKNILGIFQKCNSNTALTKQFLNKFYPSTILLFWRQEFSVSDRQSIIKWTGGKTKPVSREDLIQPVHLCSLISVFRVHLKKLWVLRYLQNPQRLHGCAGWSESFLGAHYFVCFAVPWLICT